MCAMSPRLLRPIASGIHPEAADWRARVVANGGTVSGSTLQAVSRFCASISAAGIRDRFYRLGIFAGSNLNAALVPLYRGPTFGGTTYGNATDTNVGPFVSDDFTESTGIEGDGASKSLDTGLRLDSLPTEPHMAVWVDSTGLSGATGKAAIGADNFSSGSNVFWVLFNNTDTAFSLRNSTGTGIVASGTLLSGQKHLLVTGNGSCEVYENGILETPGNGTPWVANALTVAVFAGRRNAGYADYYPGVISHYSLGNDMTDTQAAAYYAAISAFQMSMGRS